MHDYVDGLGLIGREIGTFRYLLLVVGVGAAKQLSDKENRGSGLGKKRKVENVKRTKEILIHLKDPPWNHPGPLQPPDRTIIPHDSNTELPQSSAPPPRRVRLQTSRTS